MPSDQTAALRSKTFWPKKETIMVLPRIGMAERFLGRTQLIWCTAIVLATSLMTACDSGKWVDFPVPLSAEEFEKIKKHDPNAPFTLEELGRPICANLGKHYTGEARYEKGGVQVKCE